MPTDKEIEAASKVLRKNIAEGQMSLEWPTRLAVVAGGMLEAAERVRPAPPSFGKCDHALHEQGDIIMWPFNVDNAALGGRVTLTWCARCGAVKSSIDDEWRLPRARPAPLSRDAWVAKAARVLLRRIPQLAPASAPVVAQYLYDDIPVTPLPDSNPTPEEEAEEQRLREKLRELGEAGDGPSSEWWRSYDDLRSLQQKQADRMGEYFQRTQPLKKGEGYAAIQEADAVLAKCSRKEWVAKAARVLTACGRETARTKAACLYDALVADDPPALRAWEDHTRTCARCSLGDRTDPLDPARCEEGGRLYAALAVVREGWHAALSHAPRTVAEAPQEARTVSTVEEVCEAECGRADAGCREYVCTGIPYPALSEAEDGVDVTTRKGWLTWWAEKPKPSGWEPSQPEPNEDGTWPGTLPAVDAPDRVELADLSDRGLDDLWQSAVDSRDHEEVKRLGAERRRRAEEPEPPEGPQLRCRWCETVFGGRPARFPNDEEILVARLLVDHARAEHPWEYARDVLARPVESKVRE